MKWRVVMEVTDGAVRVHEIGGGAAVDEYSPRTIGLTLVDEAAKSWPGATADDRQTGAAKRATDRSRDGRAAG